MVFLVVDGVFGEPESRENCPTSKKYHVYVVVLRSEAYPRRFYWREGAKIGNLADNIAFYLSVAN